MVESKASGLSAYLGKYADKVFVDGQPVLKSDEFSIEKFCPVTVRTDSGNVYRNMRLGPTEIYAYPDGKQWEDPVFRGILDENGYLIPCHKDERGNFEIISPNQEIQVITSTDNLLKEAPVPLPVRVLKVNFLEHRPVFQSEEVIKTPDGKSAMEADAFTVTHMSDNQPVGPIEFYANTPDGRGKPELVGLLGMDGQLTPCVRNADGNFEIEDENHQKQVIISAENELKKDPNRPYQVFRTDYFMGQPIYQQMTKEVGREAQVAQVLPRAASAEALNRTVSTAQQQIPHETHNSGMMSRSMISAGPRGEMGERGPSGPEGTIGPGGKMEERGL